MLFRLLHIADASEAVQIGTDLSVAILRGELPAGSRLPSVREVAHRYGVTVPTAQRALCVPEAWGLIEVRRGRQGSRVLDPREVAGFELWPLRIEAVADNPGEAARLLGALLAVRRAMLAQLWRAAPDPAGLLSDVATELAPDIASATTPAEVQRVDLELAARLLERSGLPAAGAILASIRRVLTFVPAVAEAMYGDAAVAQGRLLRLVELAESDALAGLDPVAWLEQVDHGTVRRFEALVREMTEEAACAG